MYETKTIDEAIDKLAKKKAERQAAHIMLGVKDAFKRTSVLTDTSLGNAFEVLGVSFRHANEKGALLVRYALLDIELALVDGLRRRYATKMRDAAAQRMADDVPA